MNEYSGQAYTWSLTSYASGEEIERLLRIAKHWAYCLHDKDKRVDEQGEVVDVEPHTHIICTFEQRKSLEQIKKALASESNTLGMCRRKQGDEWTGLNVKGLYQYLIHEKETDKVRYQKEDRVVDEISYWKRYEDNDNVNDNNAELLKDLTADYETEKEFLVYMALKYGASFIRYNKQYLDFRARILK